MSEGFLNVFRLHYIGPRYPTESANVLSVIQNPFAAKETNLKEIRPGRMSGPYKSRPISTLRTSPIGIVPKSDNTWGLVTHLSFLLYVVPVTLSKRTMGTVTYSRFDNVLDMIGTLGRV